MLENKRGNRYCFKITAAVLVMMLIFTLIPAASVHGAVKTYVNSPTLVDSFETGDKDGTDYMKIKTLGSTIDVEYKSLLPAVKYRVSLRKIGTSTSFVLTKDISGNGQFTTDLNISDIANGTYYLLVSRAANASQAVGYSYIGGAHGYCFIGVPIKISSGNAKICEYTDVITYNQKVRRNSSRTVSRSMLKNLSDVNFVFNDPVTKKRSVGTTVTKMKTYFKNVSAKVCGNADSDYEKMRKIYAYVAGNIYYDNDAFKSGTRQYVNPYKNLYNLRNNKSSANSKKTSSGKAKVATTCIGYASMVAALGRAQGIPCRIVYGHALTAPWNTWSTEKSISKLDHWWAEAYIDGRWIVVDATRGTNAKWYRSSGKWNKLVDGVLTYNYFDPSEQFLANTNLYQGIK